MVKRISLIFLFLWLAGNCLTRPSVAEATTDSLAFDFNLTDLDNNRVSLSDFRGSPTVLFFWTTWCHFCVKELRLLNNSYAQLTEDGFELLAINIGEPAYRVNDFIKNYHLTSRVLLDEDETVAMAYGLIGVPTYVIVDREGYIRFKGNAFPRNEYQALISE
ncbi:MAG: TlpA family protein disulfide reductase [Candidatus Omnitrophica bacterium]|nr:TlpA family protein disulfide reductase [Candidatus Omnitrophota bacterium]MBU4345704.1 TlpA family protein disulfide reductase [Candidatus Omnitrophota bacterium]MBU4473167.1 TlpA family protein disulfide reductase [Candidatus Omnitrophota bacterium]MCG2706454.1 TlpA family protein disulfide reductase [Candidatus Omnitrophota bacterium]